MSTNFLEALEANAKLPATVSNPLSAAGQVRMRLPEIEAALALGFTHRQIQEQLNRDGIDITTAYYHRLIPKLRSETSAAEIDSKPQPASVQLAREGSEKTDRPVAQQRIHDRVTTAAQANTKSDDLLTTIAAPPVVKPRTISSGKSDGPKFPWDPKGAEKFDPDKL
jgi:hypothetical protein